LRAVVIVAASATAATFPAAAFVVRAIFAGAAATALAAEAAVAFTASAGPVFDPCRLAAIWFLACSWFLLFMLPLIRRKTK